MAKKTERQKLEKKLDDLWRRCIQVRDKTCRICNHDGRLEAHHIMGRRHKATRWDIENGILLCWNHHVKYGHADPENLRDNMIDCIGIEKYNALKEKSRNNGKAYRLSIEDLKELMADLTTELRNLQSDWGE